MWRRSTDRPELGFFRQGRVSVGTFQTGAPMKILLAEDNVGIRTVILNMLIAWGYEVTVAPDGNDAWQKLQAPDAPRLIILDWMMPGMNGLEICRRLREMNT